MRKKVAKRGIETKTPMTTKTGRTQQWNNHGMMISK